MDYWTRFITWCQRPNKIKLRLLNSDRVRVELSRGVKVGVVAGGIHGALLGFTLNVVNNIIYGIIKGRLELYLDSFMAGGISTFGSILSYILFGAIFGLIFGLIFAALYDKLPGKAPATKGIMTSIIFWGTILLGVPSLYHLYSGGIEGLYWFLYSMGWEQTATGIYLAIPSGWLLGRFWTSKRLSKR